MIPVDDYVIDVLLPDLAGHDHSPAAYLVFLLLWRETVGRNKKEAALSHQQMSEATGLSKSAVQVAVRRLLRRKLIIVERAHATAVPRYAIVRHWRK